MDAILIAEDFHCQRAMQDPMLPSGSAEKQSLQQHAIRPTLAQGRVRRLTAQACKIDGHLVAVSGLAPQEETRARRRIGA